MVIDVANAPFPVGTVVGLYDSGEAQRAQQKAQPAATVLKTATVSSTGELRFTGLDPDTTYFAAALVSGSWVWQRLRTEETRLHKLLRLSGIGGSSFDSVDPEDVPFEVNLPGDQVADAFLVNKDGEAILRVDADGVLHLAGLAVSEIVRLRSETPRSIYEFGPFVIGDSSPAVRDANSATIEAALESVPAADRLGMLTFPVGKAYLARSIIAKRRGTVWQGAAGSGLYPGTIFSFPAGVPGVIFPYYAETDDGGAADFNVWRDIAIEGAGTPGVHDPGDSDAHGIDIRAHGVRIENFAVWNFAGNGIHIDTGTPIGNANNFRLDTGTVYYCGGSGLYTHGNDANAGLIENVDCSYNANAGFEEKSFLGNTYVMCHAATNGVREYDVQGAVNASSFFGCYSESGTPFQSKFVGVSLFWVGGTEPDFDPADASGTVIVNGEWRHHVLKLKNTKSASEPLELIAGELGAGVDRILTFSAEGRLIALDYDGAGWWTLGSDANAQRPFHISDQSAPEGPGHIRFPDGFFMGVGGTKRKWENGTAAPTTGTWAVGDRVWNVNPVAGGTEGWVCVSAGTPGTWKTFGSIAA